ncbi:hypothetical protein AB0M54_44430 [Actinoplanes sp. NPDC051470]|uniref:hypothetical protein n=1 Tax=unclassified Actinoplanes TaxID=2626549 RepID=UPI003430E451
MTSPDGLDRYTADRSAMDRIDGHGREFGTAWGAQHTMITTGEGGIRTGTLADIFQRQYEAAEAMKQSAAGVPGTCADMAGLGHVCADLYDQGEDNAARGFLRVRPVDP